MLVCDTCHAKFDVSINSGNFKVSVFHDVLTSPLFVRHQIHIEIINHDQEMIKYYNKKQFEKWYTKIFQEDLKITHKKETK